MKVCQTENELYSGRLQVFVYDMSVASPINRAAITVKDYETGETLLEKTTDISGKSIVSELPAPSLLYSQSPDQPMPYAMYDVTVNAEGFETTEINGVQIYPDETAVQNVFLVPLSRDEGTQEINILPPTLWGDYPEKIPEDEEKDVSGESGFIVLDQVVVPEFIVVHDGLPDNPTAPNYYIPFKDYIKNVASSEIYTTWPQAAITANILAIISFTLNRVYTEWYRNQGKNFTITSSTAYDHFFVYGRNIYEEISLTVDEIFTTYIKRVGRTQPLLAQYCDGSRVSCPGWLSQWGSKYLAEQGYGAVDILRYYYGNDIYLESAAKVSGIPVSFPGEILQNGSRGDNVRTIQRQLNAISVRYPAIPRIAVDGIYGDRTTESVIAFQGIFSIPQSGIVDFSTWYQISKVYVAVERLAEV